MAKTVFLIEKCIDYDGNTVPIAVFTCPDEAEYLDGQLPIGCRITKLPLCDSVDDFNSYTLPDLRASALAKLSEAEKRALGLM